MRIHIHGVRPTWRVSSWWSVWWHVCPVRGSWGGVPLVGVLMAPVRGQGGCGEDERLAMVGEGRGE